MRKFLAIIVLLSIYSCSSAGKGTASTSKESNQNDGSSIEKAIVIKASNERNGVSAEYTKLDKLFPNYRVKSQGVTSKGSKEYDVISIVTSTGEDKVIYFDITNFYGKF